LKLFAFLIYLSPLKLGDLKNRYLPVKPTERKENGYEKK
jgi:hypothetical protein